MSKMSMKRSGEDGEHVPSPQRRRGLKAALAITVFAAVDQILPFVAYRDNQTRAGRGRIDTKRLTLVAPGIGRKDADDVVRALYPSLGGEDNTVASLVYSDARIDPRWTADAIRASGCQELVPVGQSIGGGHMVQVIGLLVPDILAGRIDVPATMFLNSPYNDSTLKLGALAADALARVPAGFVKKVVGEPIAFGGNITNASPQLGDSQLDFAAGFDGARYVPGIRRFIGRALYVGDSSPDSDGVVYTVQSSQHYKADLGHKLTVELVDGLGHPDPAKNIDQAAVYNSVISDFMKSIPA